MKDKNEVVDVAMSDINLEAEVVEEPVVKETLKPVASTGYSVKINRSVNLRKGPGKNFPIVDVLEDKEVAHMITKESDGEGAALWGKLKTGGWVALDFTKKI